MMNKTVFISMYHYVRDLKNSAYPEIKGLDLNLFRQQLHFFKENFHVIHPNLLIDAVQKGTELPEKSLVLTFDDGYIDHYTDVYPLLKEYGFSGVFSMPGKIIAEKKVLDVNKVHFLLASQGPEVLLPILMERMDFYREAGGYPSNQELYEAYAVANRFDSGDVIFIKRMLQVILPETIRNLITQELFCQYVTDDEAAFCRELYLNLDQVKEMHANGMVFAYHGYDHYWMNHLKPDELRKDIASALEVFRGVIDPEAWICCYPYGSYSDEAIEISKSCGAVIGFSTDVGPYRIGEVSPFQIPRFDTNDFPPKSQQYLSFLD